MLGATTETSEIIKAAAAVNNPYSVFGNCIMEIENCIKSSRQNWKGNRNEWYGRCDRYPEQNQPSLYSALTTTRRLSSEEEAIELTRRLLASIQVPLPQCVSMAQRAKTLADAVRVVKQIEADLRTSGAGGLFGGLSLEEMISGDTGAFGSCWGTRLERVRPRCRLLQ